MAILCHVSQAEQKVPWCQFAIADQANNSRGTTSLQRQSLGHRSTVKTSVKNREVVNDIILRTKAINQE